MMEERRLRRVHVVASMVGCHGGSLVQPCANGGERHLGYRKWLVDGGCRYELLLLVVV